jgi:LysM repeat protein
MRNWRSGLVLLLLAAAGAGLAGAPVAAGAPRAAGDARGAALLVTQYVVQPGETLAKIAVRFRLFPARLARANGLPGPDAPVRPGQVLVIPQPAHSGRAGGPSTAPIWPAAAKLNHLGTPRVVLADYMMWYQPSTFDGRQTFDLPAAGPYTSADPATINRQVAEAERACLNGFAAHWFGPGEPNTTRNFDRLLQASARTNLRHAVLLLVNFWPGASEQSIAEAIRHVRDNWAGHPSYLRLGGRPVLFFTDMTRPWNGTRAALAGWQRIRQATDPNHEMIWMAEGLVTTFNPLFDGLYVYRIDHRDSPQAWLKQPLYARALRQVEAQANLPLGGLYWADSIAPGYDDTRAANVPLDLRSPAPAFARDRRNGGYYADTFAVTAQTGGDMLLVKSYNEWVEGTAIEPGAGYGNLYMDMTCRFANEFRSR